MTKTTLNLLLFVFFLLLLPLIIAGIFAVPISDDFTHAYAVEKLGVMQAWWNKLQTWDGRYFATFLIYFLLRNFPWIYGFSTISLFLIFFSLLAYIYFFISFPIFQNNKRKQLFWALLSFLFYLGAVQNVRENFLWLSGGITYQFTAAGMLFLLGFLIRKTFVLSSSKKIHYPLVAVFSFLLAGGMEIYTAMFLFFLFFGGSLTSLYQPKASFLWLVAFLFCLLGTMAMIFSPGNETRVELVKHSSHIYQYFYLVLTFLKSPLFWISTIFALVIWKIAILELLKKTKFWFFVYLLFYTSCFLLLIWLYTTNIQHFRIYSIFAFPVSCGWLPIVWYIQRNFDFMQLFKKETYFYIPVFLLIVLSSFSLGYKNLVIDFFNGSIISYRSQTLQRIALIQKMKREGKEDIVVPSFL